MGPSRRASKRKMNTWTLKRERLYYKPISWLNILFGRSFSLKFTFDIAALVHNDCCIYLGTSSGRFHGGKVLITTAFIRSFRRGYRSKCQNAGSVSRRTFLFLHSFSLVFGRVFKGRSSVFCFFHSYFFPPSISEQHRNWRDCFYDTWRTTEFYVTFSTCMGVDYPSGYSYDQFFSPFALFLSGRNFQTHTTYEPM